MLQGARRAPPVAPPKPRLIVAGATGVLGNEVLNRLAGGGAFSDTQVLAREPITVGLRGVSVAVVPSDDPSEWPPSQADAAVVMFEPARLFYDRERALWTPVPDRLPALAAWLRRSGVASLAVVLPHLQGRLPEALKHGLANLDEQAVAALHFDRLLVLRSPQKPVDVAGANFPERVARFMLSVFKYMVPASEQPVRAAKVAQLLAASLELAPPGIHVAAPETVWRAGQGDARAVAASWLAR
ncbi:hypothetical protein [Ramlibacter sp.]|uniref:hypothetical protein n=1 Tax=Ramlibacter sp. TaxID=1917967 RepID=UPI003D0E7306